MLHNVINTVEYRRTHCHDIPTSRFNFKHF